MARFKLIVEYDGRPFAGWQAQSGQPSVQAALERAAAALTGGACPIVGAGRTDAGVQAAGQAAHIDVADDFPAAKLADALNAHLRPEPVAILSAARVAEDFHARFSARARHYRYRIVNRRADLTFERGLAWRIPAPLDAAAMGEDAQALIGSHDFTTFRDAQCQAASPVKTLDRIEVTRREDRIDVEVSARSFLHRQVRSIVGSLVEIGRGRRPVGWMAEILAAADRATCGPVAPADGLYLERVDYPE